MLHRRHLPMLTGLCPTGRPRGPRAVPSRAQMTAAGVHSTVHGTADQRTGTANPGHMLRETSVLPPPVRLSTALGTSGAIRKPMRNAGAKLLQGARYQQSRLSATGATSLSDPRTDRSGAAQRGTGTGSARRAHVPALKLGAAPFPSPMQAPVAPARSVTPFRRLGDGGWGWGGGQDMDRMP